MIAVADPVEVGIREFRADRARRGSLFGSVDDGLCIGHVVDCGDRTVSDAQFFVDDFDHWGEAVGRAGRRGDKPVCIRIAKVVVQHRRQG